MASNPSINAKNMVGGLSFEVIEFLQPFITEKESHECDLIRQEKVFVAGRGTGDRHRGHTWCDDTHCGCPCHWPRDALVVKLIEAQGQYEIPEPVKEWLLLYVQQQKAEAKRLRSQAYGRDAMIGRVAEAFGIEP